MGLIRAALGAAGGVMADQWKEYFYCESIPENVMAVKGLHRVSDVYKRQIFRSCRLRTSCFRI